MRKLFLFVFAMLVFAAPAAAQTIGFKVGPTFSKMDIEDAEDLETLTNFGGGGFIRFGAGPIGFQAELLAMTKGFKQAVDTDVDMKLKATYVEIPVTAVFSLPAGPYLFAGPAVGFEVSCDAELDGDEGEIPPDCGDGFERKKLDFSLHGGAGIQFPAGPGSILLEGRYIHGLANLNDSAEDDSSAKHRTFAVMAGYAIKLGF